MEDGHSLDWQPAKSTYRIYHNYVQSQRYVTTTKSAEFIINAIVERYDGVKVKGLWITRSTNGEPPVVIFTKKDIKKWKRISITD